VRVIALARAHIDEVLQGGEPAGGQLYGVGGPVVGQIEQRVRLAAFGVARNQVVGQGRPGRLADVRVMLKIEGLVEQGARVRPGLLS